LDLSVDDAPISGQVATLLRRLELLAPDHKRLTAELTVLDRAASDARKAPDQATALDRANRQAAKIRLQLSAVTREMESLQGIVDARLSQARKRR
jgi:hypothetical protein